MSFHGYYYYSIVVQSVHNDYHTYNNATLQSTTFYKIENWAGKQYKFEGKCEHSELDAVNKTW